MLETIDSTLESVLKSSTSISFYYKIVKYQSEDNLKWAMYVAVILQSINMIQNIIKEQVIQLQNLINFENRKYCYEDQKCLICLNAEMSSFLPILSNEVFTFNYNNKRGVELEFIPRKKE